MFSSGPPLPCPRDEQKCLYRPSTAYKTAQIKPLITFVYEVSFPDWIDADVSIYDTWLMGSTKNVWMMQVGWTVKVESRRLY